MNHFTLRDCAPVFLSIIFGLIVAIGWSRWTYTASTDFGLHYALLQHIYSHLALPQTVLPNLEEMSFYPPIPYVIGAAAGYVFGSPITGMNGIAVISVFGSYLAIMSLMRFDNITASLSAAVIFLLAIGGLHGLNIVVGNELVQNYFYSQIVAMLIVLLVIRAAFSGRFQPVQVAIASVVITYCLGWVYPIAVTQFACAALAYFGLGMLQAFMTKNRKSAVLNASVLCLLIFVLPAAFVFHPTFTLIKAIAAWNGSVSSSVTLVTPILLASGIPILALTVTYLIGRLRVANPLAITVTALGLFGAALAQILAFSAGFGTPYGIAKHLFPVVTISIATLAVLIINFALPWLEGRSRPTMEKVSATVAAFAAFLIVFSIPARSLTPMIHARSFLVQHLPPDGDKATVPLNDDLAEHEKFGLALGDLHYAKKAAAVRIIGPQTVLGYYDPNEILAAAPMKYTLLTEKQKKPEQCVVAKSGNLVLISVECKSSTTAH